MDFKKPKKVFIVDDDKMFTELLMDHLIRKAPHQVTAFITGEDCLEHLSEMPDIIVLDYYLNAVTKDAANGLEILQIIKKSYPQINVVMLSSQERYSLAMETIQKGAEQYVIKDDQAFDKILKIIDES